MQLTISELESRFLENFNLYKSAPDYSKPERKQRLLSQADMLCRSREGMDFLYQMIVQLNEAGIFAGTPWANPAHLVPALVSGTLLAGYPNSTMEIMSELRQLAIMNHRIGLPHYSSEQAKAYLEDVLVSNFELAYEDFYEKAWLQYNRSELEKIDLLFDTIKVHIPLESLLGRIADTLESISAHRPIVVTKMKRIITAIYKQLQWGEQHPEMKRLERFIKALHQPTPLSAKYEALNQYERALEKTDFETLKQEAEQLGTRMSDTGLVSNYHVILIRHITDHHPGLIPLALALNAHGEADYERHSQFVAKIIGEFITLGNNQSVYGLARVLQRNLFSRKVTWHAFNQLITVKLHPEVKKGLLKGNVSKYELNPMQMLVGGVLCILGLPLGVRQGYNPTCQSARGISMWSRHAPGKLINLLIDTARSNNLIFRYEGKLIESASVVEGLVRQFDYKLDPVSIVLVPHLDKIYNEMMKLATAKHIGKDPHISVNPAFYGHWIQAGFKSVYNPITGYVDDYEAFVRTFYASFHPEFNGGHAMVYPVPLGIFITDAHANMLGYHAISLLRIQQADTGEWRAYFFNPNSEGKQNWGQEIHPTVSGNGEFYGESSLPVDEFVSRVYAYHYNELRLENKDEEVPSESVARVSKLSRESWGKKYTWI
jgi:hypothetical protein